ncbi:MAG: LPS-assembly protein LptD [Alphaproteobacteria bacterium]|nr:LPS-assembly protein LptD [Alphaproteobacteria bacterium]MBN2779494.1 LPS-assembly protein LptD [Alphaproteobacteria bacterium]
MNRWIIFFTLAMIPFAPHAEQIKVEADSITFDHNTGIATADGGVHATNGETELKAPHATYNTEKKSFASWGGIEVKKENGESFRTESIYSEDGLNNVNLDSLKLNLSDGASVEAKSVSRKGEKIILENPSYTSCDRSKDCLPWEIKASRVSKTENSMQYTHARLNLYGVPVFYTPYLSHPTPEARRQSGLLFPKIGSSADLGGHITMPYYIALSDTHDLTLLPMFTSEEGNLMGAEHRKNFTFGETRTKGTFTQNSETREKRWYVFSDNIVNLTPVWRGFLNFKRVSDDTFLRKYDIDENTPYLESRGGFEGLWNRSYLTLNMHSFQDLRSDSNETALPKILPILNYDRKFNPLVDGSFFSLNFNTAHLEYDNDGTHTRTSGRIGWTKPWLQSFGWKWTLDLSVRADAYNMDNVPLNTTSTLTDDELRLTPQAMLQWEWAFLKTGEKSAQILKPIVQFVASPNEKDEPNNIPNIDSQSLRLDDTNLFSTNRFSGYDRIETGRRINYGLAYDIIGQNIGKVHTFFGQSYRFKKDETITEESSLNDTFSDYVGRVIFDFNRYFKSAYRAQVDEETLSVNRQEVDLFLDLDRFYFQTNYIFNNEWDETISTVTTKEEIYGKTFVKLTHNWGTYLYDRHNMTTDKQIEIGAGLIYENDCFKFDLGARREYTSDRDYEGQESFFVTFTFKTLGSTSMGKSWEDIKKENQW